MSASSGIKVSSTVTDAFAKAVAEPSSVRALLLLIEGEEFQHKSTIAPKGNYKEDIALLPPSLPTPTSCASWVYRTDTKDGSGWEWMMVTFVPDGAGVRQKMLQASSRAGLMKALGEGKFKDNLFATSLNDLTTSSFTSHINHMSSPPPLTASEKALADVKAAEAEESRREQLGGAQRRGNAVVPVKMKWSNELVAALKGLNEPVSGDQQGKIVCVQIEPKTETLTLLLSKTITTGEISKTLPPSAPCFTFFSWPGSGTAASAPASTPVPPATEAAAQAADEGKEDETAAEDKTEETEEQQQPSPVIASPVSLTKAEPPKILFIYTCPSSSPVRHRMLYSSSVQFVIKESESQTGVVVSKKVETSDLEDLTPVYLQSELFPAKQQVSSASAFSRPAIKTSGLPAQTGARPFGAPMPVRKATASTASQVPLPPTPTGSVNVNGGAEEEDRKAAIASAFNAFGPRVGSPAGGPGFARPKPAARR